MSRSIKQLASFSTTTARGPPHPRLRNKPGLNLAGIWVREKLVWDKMAANSEEPLEERTMGEELLETKGPVAPRSLTVEDGSEDENENSGDILDEQDDEERNPLLELKKCKDWLQQQKINHEAELLVRKLLILTHE